MAGQGEAGKVEAGKYRKRPLPAEAMQIDPGNGAEVAEWCGGEWDQDAVLVPTAHGQVPAFAGDWVIRATWSEFYPVSAAVFAEGYEREPTPEAGAMKLLEEGSR